MKNLLLLLVSTIVLLGSSCKKNEIEKEPIQVQKINDSIISDSIDTRCYEMYDIEVETKLYDRYDWYKIIDKDSIVTTRDSDSYYRYCLTSEKIVKRDSIYLNYINYCAKSICNDKLIYYKLDDTRYYDAPLQNDTILKYYYVNYDDTTKNKYLGSHSRNNLRDTIRDSSFVKIYKNTHIYKL